MQYMLLVYRDEAGAPDPKSDAFREMVREYSAFADDAKARGAHRGGLALQSTSTATTVRVQDGKVLVTDGPFAETTAQLAGFYLLDCADLDEALDYASRIPGARVGGVEIRPVVSPERG